ncbi:hypothetical protein L1889_07025 [Paenalcaligenes niemegkensis]|uniref:hypothetical protein n=1 Tax=Paenalcaligenes niemegkensis TaxID=2895469 RepID=UPI001EE8662F|nr:hypothetical protein [Paenalcaligenes niemegkensis]MCQ9616491.1 hypothetical protein [Paenalcaligenes niemegkensis]
MIKPPPLFKLGVCVVQYFKSGELYAVPVGLFEQGAKWSFELQVFVDEKPGNYQFANATHEMTGADVFDAWSSK